MDNYVTVLQFRACPLRLPIHVLFLPVIFFPHILPPHLLNPTNAQPLPTHRRPMQAWERLAACSLGCSSLVCRFARVDLRDVHRE